jgi:hypothetical protein
MNRSLICILPSFFDNSGHEIDFINILLEIANKKKLKINFLLPKNNILKVAADHKKELFGSYDSIFIFKFFYIIGNYFILLKRLKRLKKDDLVYIDGYSCYFLISFILYFLTNANLKNLVIWIRYPYDNFIKKYIFKFFIYSFNKDSEKQFISITENTNLAKLLNKRFSIKVSVLPSHHNLEKFCVIDKKNKSNKSKINILCPGSFRPEKFGDNLLNFLENNIENKKNFILNINKKFKNFYKNIYKFNIRFVKDSIQKFEYVKAIHSSDIIILPYDFREYKLRTSGIFFEAISIGKIVFVTSDTLMSKELKKNNLEDLTVKNWSNMSIQYFINIKNDKSIKRKLSKMKNNYLKINNKQNFTNKFLEIIES